MKDLSQFATDKFPIRCSQLALLSRCTARSAMFYDDNWEDGESGEASDNGSLTHVGIAEFHRRVKDKLQIRKDKAWQAVINTAAMNKFPLADPDEVRLFLEPYMNDPRNIYAEVPLIEQEVNFTLPPHLFDRTQEPICVTGHIDQIRIEHGRAKVWDYKSGKPTGLEMTFEHSVQIGAYTYGARSIPGFEYTEPGGIIRGRGYRTRENRGESPHGVFFNSPFESKDLEWLLENIRLQVALIRMGEITFGTGPWCLWCKYGGLDNCMPELKRRLEKPTCTSVPLDVLPESSILNIPADFPSVD